MNSPDSRSPSPGVVTPSATKSEAGQAGQVLGRSFYEDIDAVTKATPITTTPAQDLPKFRAEATARGKAIGGVIGLWLKKPYTVTDASGASVRGLFEELFDNRATRPVFQPGIGPVIVYQHPHVLEVLRQTDAFTVDPYGPMMELASSGIVFPVEAGKVPAGTPADPSKGFYKHYMLGTDDDSLYVPDSLISRHVVKRADAKLLRTMIRDICEQLVADVQPGVAFDVVEGLCRHAPVQVVGAYLGLPSYASVGTGGTGAFDIDGLKAGDTFPIDSDLQARFKLQVVTQGTVPTRQDLYNWVRDTFRNIFNNIARDPAVAAAGLAATEQLLVWSSRVIAYYKRRLQENGHVIDGTTVIDSMITRLLVLQNDARTPSKVTALMAAFDCKTEEELLARTADDRIQVNAFGTFVGAVVNPEEANGRLFQSLLRFREGSLVARADGGSYAELCELARGATSGDTNMPEINAYALEFLRLNPQGETLLRKCSKDATIGGVEIKAGTLVFNCIGAAMHDPDMVPEAAKVDVHRSPEAVDYAQGADTRVGEEAQSTLYLQHGHGRHKCLGRYASEITMQEVLRAVLRRGDPVREGDNDLELDADGLYARSFILKVC